MSLAPFIQTLGRGPARSRNLTQDEAEQAMALILDGSAAPEAIGAMMMLMRYRGENGAEIAGFVRAMRTSTGWGDTVAADVDWPSYAAGRTRGLPLFLLSAKLLARAGYRVCLHGWNSHQNPVADVRAALPKIDIPIAKSADDAARALDASSIAYIPLEALSAPTFELLRLRDVLGLRSPVNTALRAFNPTGASLSVQGVFHPPYRDLQRDAAELLGQRNLMVLKGAGGEFERNPTKIIALHGLVDGEPFDETAPALIEETRRMDAGRIKPLALEDIWSGAIKDHFCTSVIISTAALALSALGKTNDANAMEMAQALWVHRAGLVDA